MGPFWAPSEKGKVSLIITELKKKTCLRPQIYIKLTRSNDDDSTYNSSLEIFLPEMSFDEK